MGIGTMPKYCTFSPNFQLTMKILIESSLDSSIKQQALLGKMIDFLIKSIHARLIRIARFILEEFFFCAFPDLRFRSIPRYWTIHYGIFFFNYLNFPRFSTHLFSYIPELLVIDVFLSKTCPNSSLFHQDVAFCNIEKTSIYIQNIYLLCIWFWIQKRLFNFE